MSGKLLHELLRDWANDRPFSFNEAWRTLGVAGNNNMLAAFADEIERQYVPVPRFPDGEPVREGSETRYGTVSYIDVEVSDTCWGNWIIHTDDDNCIDGTLSQRVERPAPKSLDADGVETKAGDTVWDIEMYEAGNLYWGLPLKVIGCSETHITVRRDSSRSSVTKPCECFTHREPDSLEKLRDDIAEWRADVAVPGNGWDIKTAEWCDRLTALMERGA